MTNLDLLLDGAESLGISLTAKQLGQFEKYQELLLEWNQRINLTAVREIDQILVRHFLDSLTCVQATGDLNQQSLVDVGSGAGFPGLPLKICFPDLKLTLIESVQKKAGFLQTVKEVLQLNYVSIFSARAEDIGRLAEHREIYDWAAARAVAPLRVLVEYLIPLTRIGGYILAQKGGGARIEVVEAEQAISLLGGGPVELIPVRILGGDLHAYLVKIPKTMATPDRYPRRVGIPAKRPL
jgi:16S rRNA (guanine527-N7)-methyltransferase